MGFSIILSFVLWCIVSVYISLGNEGDQEKTIADVPIIFDFLENEEKEGELRAFSGKSNENTTATVSIKGNRLIVGRITKNDIQVTATNQSNTITSVGTYNMVLSAKKNSTIKNYSIVSISPNFVKVMVDRYKEQRFDIQSNIAYDADPEYFVGKTKFSPSNVLVSGPDSLVSKIERVVATKKIDYTLTESTSFEAKIILYDKNNEEINSDFLIVSLETVKTTIPILFKKSLSTKVQFKNGPIDMISFISRVKLSLNEVEMAGPKKFLENLKEVNLSPLDACKIDLENNSFDVSVETLQDCRTVNENLSVKVEIDTIGLSEKEVSVKKYNIVNVADDKNIEVKTDHIDVKVVGPEHSVRTATGDDFVIKLDLQGTVINENTSRQIEVPAQIEAPGKKDCWIYGKYTAKIDIK
jgi:YbbR domain-containing protein